MKEKQFTWSCSEQNTLANKI